MQTERGARVVDMELRPLIARLDGWSPRRATEPPEVVDEHEKDLWYDYDEAQEGLDTYTLEDLEEHAGDLDTVRWSIELVGEDHALEVGSYVAFSDEEVMVYLLDALLNEIDDPLGTWEACNDNERERARVVTWFSSHVPEDDMITEYSGWKPEDYDHVIPDGESLVIDVGDHLVAVGKED